MTSNELEDERSDGVILIGRVLELGKRPGGRLIERHAESDSENSIICSELTLCDTCLVKNPWAVNASGGQERDHVGSVVELLHNGPIPFLAILDAGIAFSIRRAKRLEDAAACIREQVPESFREIRIAAVVTDENKWALGCSALGLRCRLDCQLGRRSLA